MKLGTLVGAMPGPDAIALKPGEGEPDVLLNDARARGWITPENATDLEHGIYENGTRQIRLDTGARILTVNTPRTIGVAGPEGTSAAAGPLTVKFKGSWAAAWASSVDGKPIPESARILFAHVTDVKNTGDRFAGRDRKVLEAWGDLPYLVRAGKAAVSLRHPRAKALKVWRLDLTGKRTGRMPAKIVKGALTFTADTATKPDGTLLYEIAGR
jgi:hypothetical protein